MWFPKGRWHLCDQLFGLLLHAALSAIKRRTKAAWEMSSSSHLLKCRCPPPPRRYLALMKMWASGRRLGVVEGFQTGPMGSNCRTPPTYRLWARADPAWIGCSLPCMTWIQQGSPMAATSTEASTLRARPQDHRTSTLLGMTCPVYQWTAQRGHGPCRAQMIWKPRWRGWS